MKIKYSQGMTLIELMVGVSVLAILLSLSFPSFRSLIDKNNVDAAVNDLQRLVQYARTEAVTQRKNVKVCLAEKESNTCVKAPSLSNRLIVLGENSELLYEVEFSKTQLVLRPVEFSFAVNGKTNNKICFIVSSHSAPESYVELNEYGMLKIKKQACAG